MKLILTEEQEMIRSMVRDFAEKELRLIAREIDEEERFPEESMPKLAGLGLMGMTIPKEYGGSATDNVSYAIAIEEISRVCAATGTIVSVNNSLVCEPINKHGTEEQKEKFLTPLAKGDKLGAYALTEPNAGSDAASLRTTFKKDGDGYVLNGSKNFVSNGSKSSTFIVFASVDRNLGHKGISAFLVSEDTEGFTKGKKEKKLGIRGSDTISLNFENCPLPKDNLLGKEGEGFRIAMSTLDSGRIGIASQAVGIGQGALEESVKYSGEREQFGGPISKFQAIQWMLADMATEIEASRLLVYKAAAFKDAGQKFSTESSMAKLFASDVAVRAARMAVQIHGGYGFTKDYDVERFYRDAKITEIYEGTSEVQKFVIARSLLK
jgi:butyryl-CoA dehydrogenase